MEGELRSAAARELCVLVMNVKDPFRALPWRNAMKMSSDRPSLRPCEFADAARDLCAHAMPIARPFDRRVAMMPNVSVARRLRSGDGKPLCAEQRVQCLQIRKYCF